MVNNLETKTQKNTKTQVKKQNKTIGENYSKGGNFWKKNGNIIQSLIVGAKNKSDYSRWL